MAVQDVSSMTRVQLRGVIGHSTLMLERFLELVERLLAAEGDEGFSSPELADAYRRLKMYRSRLEDARAEWDRRGYVVRKGPRRIQLMLEKEIERLMELDPSLSEANAEVFARASLRYRGPRLIK